LINIGLKYIYKNYIYLICLLKDGSLHYEGKILKIQKNEHFFPLHMKGSSVFSKNEKYFNFEKMDKKNVQNENAKKLLTERFFQK